jgi:hypothetical protein
MAAPLVTLDDGNSIPSVRFGVSRFGYRHSATAAMYAPNATSTARWPILAYLTTKHYVVSELTIAAVTGGATGRLPRC